MNTRTRNAAASIARSMVIGQDDLELKYMRTQSSKYGPKVFTICQSALPVEGCWYQATSSFQAATSAVE